MTIKYLESIGSPYTTGVLQGRLTKAAIANAWETLQNSTQMDFVRPRMVPKALHLLHCQKKADTFLKNYLNKYLPHQSEKITGIANGANLNTDLLYFLQALEMELVTSSDTFTMGSGTMVGVKPEKTADNEVILGKNLDYAWPLKDVLIVRKSKPKAGLQSLELTLAYLGGCLAGVNEKGIGIMLNTALATDNISLKTIPASIMIQEALQNCSTLDQAINILSSQNRDTGAIFLLADAHGEMVMLEGSRTKTAIHRTSASYLVATNHFQSPELQNLTVDLKATWSSKSHPDFKEKEIHRSSLSRYQRVLSILDNNSLLVDFDEMRYILMDHNNQPGQSVLQPGTDETICRHGDQLSTQASVIILPTQKTLHACLGYPCKGEFKKFIL